MASSRIEKEVVRLLSIGAPAISVFLLVGVLSDPVNVTKMLALSGVAFSLLAIIILRDPIFLWSNFRSLTLVSSLFVLFAIWSLINSNSPLVQNFYGLYGRNTGLLTYASLAIVLLAGLFVSSQANFRRILYGFFVTGILNVLYCAWVLAFGDFVGWYNPYGNILGLLGNPNFIAALLGMFITSVVGYALDPSVQTKTRILCAVIWVVGFFEIIQSNALQGLVVSLGGLGIVTLFKLRTVRFGVTLSSLFAIAFVTIGSLAVLGTLQHGPLSFLYKKSVSLRGTYWKSGLEMGLTHPFTGVGMDSYGDWYRRARPANALVDMPGVNTTSNVAHNVFVDMFASGGFPLFISYFAIIVIGVIAITRFIRNQRSYDGVFVAISSAWLCYQIQSLISINQVGLVIWGWLFTGLLVSYSNRAAKSDLKETPSKKVPTFQGKRNHDESFFSNNLIAGLGLLVGVFIAFPPLSADVKWFNATKSRNLQQVEEALSPTYMNPLGSFRFAEGVNLLDSSNLPEYAYRFAKDAVKFNPEYFDAWKQLYFLSSSQKEKEIALTNMKRLDPKNPDVTAP
jgi:O-antigen ligase